MLSTGTNAMTGQSNNGNTKPATYWGRLSFGEEPNESTIFVSVSRHFLIEAEPSSRNGKYGISFCKANKYE